MAKLFTADIRTATGPRPLVTVRAEGEGEARLFLAAAYPAAEIAGLDAPSDWTSDADTGTKAGDVREHPGVTWQPPAHRAG
jgi:hypothetical protein